MPLVIIFVVGCSFNKDVPPKVVEVPEKKSDSELSNELFDAVLKKDYKSVEALIKAGTNLEQYDPQGNTVLIKSTQMRDIVLVEMLLKAGAKPFSYLKDNPKETAFLKIHKDDTEIQRLFEEKVSDLKSKIAKSLTQSRFDDTLTVIQENNIPFSLSMATLPLEKYIFPFITKPTDRAENLIKYLIDGRSFEKLDVLKNQSLLVGASNTMESSEFFSYLIDKLANEKLKVPKIWFQNKSNGINVQELGLSDFFIKPQWLAKQLEVIADKKNVILDHSYMSEVSKNAIKFSISDESTATKVFAAFLKQSFPDSHKNSFTEDTLNLIYESTKNIKKSNLIKATLEVWKNQGISKSGYSLDRHTENLLQTIIKEKESQYIQVVNLFLSYTTDREATETLEKILTLPVGNEQKVNFTTFTLSYIQKIPKGAFAAAVNNNDLFMLSLLIDSKIPFDTSEQVDAIYEALNRTKTGDLAKSYLLSLKQSGLSFDNEASANALKIAINKLLFEKDLTYSVVVDFLISLADTPINSLSDTDKTQMIYDLLKSSIATNANWSRVNDFLFKSNSVKESIEIESELKISSSKNFKIKSSLPWFMILHLFEAKKVSIENFNNLIFIFKPMLKVYENEMFSMSVSEDRATVNPQLFITQQILPLSLLMWAGKDGINNSHGTNYGSIGGAFTISPVSYDSLAQNSLYAYLTTDKEFWNRIIKELLTSKNAQITIKNPKSAYALTNIVIGTDALNNFPTLIKVIQSFNKPILSSDAECRLEGVSDDEIKNWTTIGSFVALESLYQKSCSGNVLSKNEADFFKSFTAQHIENDVEEIFVNQSADACEPHNYVATNGGFYSAGFSVHGYSEMGTLLLKGQNEESDLISDIMTNPDLLYFGKKCKTSNYTPEIHLQAKLQFLKDWNNCLLNNQDTSMINFMQNLDSKYGFSKINGTVKVCK